MPRNGLSKWQSTRRHQRITVPELRFVHGILFDRLTHVESYQKHIGPGSSSAGSAQNLARKVLRRHHVRQYIRDLQEHSVHAAKVTIDKIYAGIHAIAFADRTLLFDAEGAMLPIQQWPKEIRDSIDGIEVEEFYGKPDGDGNSTLKKRKLKVTHGGARLEALHLLAKLKGLLGSDAGTQGHEDDFKVILQTDPNPFPPPPAMSGTAPRPPAIGG